MTDLSAQPTAPAFKGTVLMPGAEGYEEARRVFNGLVDRRPARIMGCTDSSDVAAALLAARREALPVSVYGGGHGVTGSAVVDGGVCIDLRRIDRIVVDPVARTLRVGGGATWGAVDAATQEFGLAVTGGRVSSTGVGGLALGSGSGWLERAFGFTCDNLLEAEVVTADGRVVTASATQNPDLFWALRGGGGNFGVVTDFLFQLHPVGPTVLGGMLMYPASAARNLVRFWRGFMTEAPDEVGSGIAFITAPPLPFVPEALRGQPVVGVVVCYAGDPAQGAEVLAPLLEYGPPAVNLVEPMPYVDFLTWLTDEAVDTLVSHATVPRSPMSQVLLVAGGGAIARVPEDATAFGQRTAPFNVHYLSIWADPADDDVNIRHTRTMAEAMRPWTTGRVYLNYIGEEGPGRVEAAYGPEKYARLRQIKRIWDPDNVFRHNQNIVPAS
jgi:FAD/FMN-containing dehydrogenase